MNRCRRGERCAASERADPEDPKSPTVGAPADRPLCDVCERAADNALTDVPQLFLDLENALPPGAAPPSAGSRRKITGSPLGVNGRVAHLQETVHQLLTVWEDAVRDLADLTMVSRLPFDPWERSTGRARAGGETQRAADLLKAHLTAWIVHPPIEYAVTQTTADPDDPKAQPDTQPIWIEQAGWEAAAALIDWKHQVRAALGVTNPPIRRREPCMYCKVAALIEINGEDEIRCEACHRRWTRGDYRTKVRGFEPYLRKLAKELGVRTG